jgi:hypothetical protein
LLIKYDPVLGTYFMVLIYEDFMAMGQYMWHRKRDSNRTLVMTRYMWHRKRDSNSTLVMTQYMWHRKRDSNGTLVMTMSL